MDRAVFPSMEMKAHPLLPLRIVDSSALPIPVRWDLICHVQTSFLKLLAKDPHWPSDPVVKPAFDAALGPEVPLPMKFLVPGFLPEDAPKGRAEHQSGERLQDAVLGHSDSASLNIGIKQRVQ